MARNPEQTKKLIIERSLPIFNTKGYNAASISDITSATGITKGAIYGNFKNKDEVATAVFDRAVEIVTGALARRIRRAETAPAKLLTMLYYYEDFIQNPPIEGGCPILNISIEADDNLPFLRAKVIRSIALMKDSIVKMINRGILEGQIRTGTDAEEFANFLFVSIEGAVSLSRVEGDLRSFRQVKKFIERQIQEIST